MITTLVHALFDYEAERRWRHLTWISVGGLYASGAVVWAYFLGWAALPLTFSDWADINVPRLLFLSNAIAAGELPLHMANTASLHGITDRFFALPDVITTPQTLLLPLLGIPRFVLFDVILHYTIGVAGVLALRRRFRWSLFTFTAVFLLVLFNGHILSQYGVGHFTWAAYFLFPWFVLFCFQLLDGEPGWRWVARVAFVMFYMVLAGGQHHFTWLLIFLACLMPFCLDRVKWIAAAGAGAVLLSTVRLLPPALNLDDYSRASWVMDVIGYPSLLHLIRAMVDLRRETFIPAAGPLPGNFVFFESNYFEFNFYVGIIGAGAVLYFGVYSWLRDREPMYRQLMLPTFIMIALSMGSVFRIVRATGIPIFMSERIVSRMVSLPMVLLMIMCGVLLQKALERGRLSFWNQLAALALMGLLAIDLSGEVRLARLAETARNVRVVAFDESVGQISRRADPAYTAALGAGAAVTLATAAGLLVLAARERRLLTHRE